jgi:nucleoside-diphosphate-sugar epimerase
MGHDIAVFSRVAPRRGDVRHIAGDRRRLGDHSTWLRSAVPDIVVDAILSSEAQVRDLQNTFRGVAKRIVAVSSMDVYRACGVLHRLEPGGLEPLPLTESSPLRTKLQTYPPAQIANLQQIFGWLDEEYDKIPVERAVLSDPALPSTVLRLPMAYGPGDKLHRFFPVVKRISDRRPAIVFTEDFAAWRGTKGYVDEVAAAIAVAAVSDATAGRIYNVGEADAPSELEWARMIATAMGWRGEFVIVPNDRAPAHLQTPANFEQHWVADTALMRKALGYRERIGREEAVRRTIEWELARPPSAIDAQQFDYAAEDAALAAFTK